jgi:hypothetical protein
LLPGYPAYARRILNAILFFPGTHEISANISSTFPVTGPIQIHIEHLYRLYLLHIHDTEGQHAPQSSLAPKTPPSISAHIEGTEAAVSPQTRDPSELSSGDAFYGGGDDDLSDDEDDGDRRRALKKKWVARRIEYGLADVILICFSLANRASFEHIETVVRNQISHLCSHVSNIFFLLL